MTGIRSGQKPSPRAVGGTRAVLFDLGGIFVCVHMERGFRALSAAFPSLPEAALREACLAPDLLGAYEKGRLSSSGFHAEINRRLGSNIPFAVFQTCWQDVFTPNPPMIRFLHNLPHCFKRIVLSNTNPLHVQYLSSHFDILNRFDGHVYSHETGTAKPEKEIFQKALSVADAKPEECVFVDDLEANVKAAEAIGIPSHHFTGNDSFFQFWEEWFGVIPQAEN
jgi:HAD superfamily hydrolase (TIGR01509 family)